MADIATVRVKKTSDTDTVVLVLVITGAVVGVIAFGIALSNRPAD